MWMRSVASAAGLLTSREVGTRAVNPLAERVSYCATLNPEEASALGLCD